MRQVKSKETKLEQQFSKLLWQYGLRYRKNNVNLFGKPDISVKSKKFVIFFDSCFWHGCSEHVRMPKSNQEYWQKKIARNRERDKKVSEYYKEKKWRIIRVWEHELRDEFKVLRKIRDLQTLMPQAGRNI